jgi:phosphatidate phosphatase LPIN
VHRKDMMHFRVVGLHAYDFIHRISEPSKVSPSTISPSSSAQTSPTLNAMRVPSPEYSWEWGAFPVRSATEPGFSDPLTDLSMHRARSVPIGVLGPSTNEFGTGGRLLPDIEDDKRFWVELEGQKFTFELSLCGALDEKDEVSALEAFESRRVSYSTFLKDDGLVESKELVLKWNERSVVGWFESLV